MAHYSIVDVLGITPKQKPTHAIQLENGDAVAWLFIDDRDKARQLIDAANAFIEEQDNSSGLHARMKHLEAERAKCLGEVAQLKAKLHGFGGNPTVASP